MSDRRAQIIETGVRLLESEGVAGLTMRRLADEMGFTPPILYDLFDGKAALLAAIADYGFSELHSYLEDEPRSAPDRRLENLFRRYIRFGLTRPVLYDVMLSQPVAVLEASPRAKAAAQMLGDVIATATGGQAGGAQHLSKLAWASLHGIVSLTRVGLIDTGSDFAAALAEQWRAKVAD